MKSLLTNEPLGKSGLCLYLEAIQPQRKGWDMCGPTNAQGSVRLVTTHFIHKLISRREQRNRSNPEHLTSVLPTQVAFMLL